MDADAECNIEVADQIVAFKCSMAPRREVLKHAFGEVKDHVGRAAEAIRNDAAAGRPVVPEVDYRDIRGGSVSDGIRQAIRRTGCAVVRGVFPASLASDWFAELGEYLEINDYDTARGREAKPRSVFLRFKGRQTADFQRLLVEAAGDGPPGPKTRRDASVIYIGSAPIRQEPRLSRKAEGGVPRRPLGARLRGHGLRGRFPGPRDGGGPDRVRPTADGILSANATEA